MGDKKAQMTWDMKTLWSGRVRQILKAKAGQLRQEEARGSRVQQAKCVSSPRTLPFRGLIGK